MRRTACEALELLPFRRWPFIEAPTNVVVKVATPATLLPFRRWPFIEARQRRHLARQCGCGCYRFDGGPSLRRADPARPVVLLRSVATVSTVALH